jgi:hypothetical protein
MQKQISSAFYNTKFTTSGDRDTSLESEIAGDFNREGTSLADGG